VSAVWLARAIAAWAGLLHGPDPAIGHDAARLVASRELSKAIFHRGPPLTRRILGAIGRWLARLFGDASGVLPGGWWALVGLAALAVIAVAAVTAWIGPVYARCRRAPGVLLPGAAVTAGDLRARAERLAADGDFSGAIIEGVRAIAAEPRRAATRLMPAHRLADHSSPIQPSHFAHKDNSSPTRHVPECLALSDFLIVETSGCYCPRKSPRSGRAGPLNVAGLPGKLGRLLAGREAGAARRT